MRAALLLISILLLVNGCTSLQTSLNAESVPQDRLLLQQPKDLGNASEIAIVRDRSFAGSTCYYAVFLDDQLAARIGVSEKAVFKLEAGNRRLKVTRDPQGAGLCSSGDDMTEQTVSLAANEKTLFRLSTNMAGGPILTQLSIEADSENRR